MAEEEMSRSILDEYSIAEFQGDLGMEQWGSLQDAFSRYAKVIFHDVADSYATDADILCCFTLSSDMQRKDGDLVALFQLGWRHPNEMITSQLVPRPANPESHDYEVIFKASDLPKNEGEIYQLCYISQNEVWGASVPFEFRRASAEELVVLESGDIAIVRSQPAVAEDLKRQLAELRKELLIAESNQTGIQEKLTKTEEQNRILQGRLNDLEKAELVLERLKAENQVLNKARDESQEALRAAELRIVVLENAIEASQKEILTLRSQLSAQVEANEKKEKESQEQSCSQDIIEALRQGKDIAGREMRAAMADNERLQTELAKVTIEKDSLLQQVEDLNKTLQMSQEEKGKCEVSFKNRIEELLAELTLLSSDTQHSVNNSSYVDVEVEALKDQIAALRLKLEDKEKEVDTLKAQKNVKSASSSEISKVKRAEEIAAIEKDLEDVTTRHQEVKNEIQSLLTDMTELKHTESALQESHTRLESKIECLRKMVADALGCDNDLEAGLHQVELFTANTKLEEKWVCILSAQARQQELEYQLEELKQESSVLSQQETQAKEAICVLTVPTVLTNSSSEDNVSSTDSNSEVTSGQDLGDKLLNCNGKSNGSLQSEVVELRERLHQAAEAYKTLYQQKVQAERKLQRMQDLKKHSESETK